MVLLEQTEDQPQRLQGKLLWSEPETCLRLGVKRNTLRKLWAERRLVPIHIGKRVFWRPDDVRRYVDSLTEKASDDGR